MPDHLRILLIEDSPGDARLIQELLRDSPTVQFELVCLDRLTAGLKRLEEETHDAVLLDLGLPDSQGLDTFRKTLTHAPDVPIVVLTGLGDETFALQAVREGAQDYLVKGQVDADLLSRALRYAIERKRAEEALRSRNRELAALNRVSYAISDALDLDAMLHRAVGAAMRVIEADGAVVRLVNPVTQQLVVAVSEGVTKPDQPTAQPVPPDQGVVGLVVQSGHPHIGCDWATDPWLAPLRAICGFRSYLCVPLRTGERIVGTLEMATYSDRAFSAREIELVMSTGNQIGLAVARAQYASELERANVDLRRLDTLREQFIQNVTHELRTPLALVHGYIEMLHSDDLNPDEKRMAVDVAHRRIGELVDLVNSITTLQDLGSQPLQMERIDAIELIRTAEKMAAQRLSKAKVTVKTQTQRDLPSFTGDFTRLAQALHHLLDNACKFSPEGSVVTVTAEATASHMRIAVADRGIGIPPEHREHIFDRFFQVDGSRSRRYGGAGLGLAIAKEVCEAHGGWITAENGKDRGCVFIVHLPRGTAGGGA